MAEGTRIHKLFLSANFDHLGGTVRFHAVAVIGAVIDIAIPFPNCLASHLVERGDVLKVESVVGDEDFSVVQDR